MPPKQNPHIRALNRGKSKSRRDSSRERRLDPKFRGEPVAGGFSPATMRKNQMATMGQHASIEVVEDAVRAVETGVLKELKNDVKFADRICDVRQRSRSTIDMVDQTETIIDQIGTRLKAVRDKTKVFDPTLEQELTKAFIQQSKLAMRATNTLTDANKTKLFENLLEAEKILENLKGVGDKRNDILLHALNGLANVKVARAMGTVQRPEVISQLFNLLQESQTLEVPHNNAQVRLNYCLKICEGIIGQQISKEDIDRLLEQVRKVEDIADALPPSPQEPDSD